MSDQDMGGLLPVLLLGLPLVLAVVDFVMTRSKTARQPATTSTTTPTTRRI